MSNIVRIDSDQKRVIVQNSGNVTVRSDEPKRVIVQTAGLQGQSAYDVAVANGFVSTETEWLTSMVGSTAASVSISLIASGAIGGHRVLVTNDDGQSNDFIFNEAFEYIIIDNGESAYRITSETGVFVGQFQE